MTYNEYIEKKKNADDEIEICIEYIKELINSKIVTVSYYDDYYDINGSDVKCCISKIDLPGIFTADEMIEIEGAGILRELVDADKYDNVIDETFEYFDNYCQYVYAVRKYSLEREYVY